MTITIQRFLLISPLHGCSFMSHRRHIVEGALWFLLGAICFGLLMNDTVNLVLLYMTEPTAIAITMQRNNSMHFTKAAWCFDVFRVNIIPSVTDAFNEATLNQTLARVAAMNQQSSALKSVALLSTDDPGFDFMMKATFLMLTTIVDYDIGITHRSALTPQAFRALTIVEQFFVSQGYTYPQLLDGTARYLCKQTEDPTVGNCTSQYYRHNKEAICFDICGMGTLTWFGQAAYTVDDICLSISSTGVVLFESVNDWIGVQPYYISRGMQLVNDWATNYGNVLWPTPAYGPPMGYFDMRGWEGMVDLRYTDGLMYCKDQTSLASGINVVSMLQLYNKPNMPCSPQTEAECAMECLAYGRMAKDGCWPLVAYNILNLKPSNVPVCTRRFTIAESANATGADEYLSAWYTCLYKNCSMRPCNLISYQYKPETSLPSPGVNVTMYASSFVYPMLTEYLTLDQDAFLAQFGGIIGLWVGGSLLSLAHVPIFFIYSFFHDLWVRRQQRLKAQDETDNIAQYAAFVNELTSVDGATLSAQRFFSESPIQGFSYVAHRRDAADGIGWFIGVLISLALSAACVFELIQVYRSEPTSIAITMQRNNTLNLNKLAFCFDIFRNHLVPSASAAYDEKSLNASFAELAKFNSMYATSRAPYPLHNLSTQDPAFDYLMKTTYFMLTSIVDYDLEIVGTILDKNTMRAVTIAEQWYAVHGYGYQQLLENTARYLCMQGQVPEVGGCTNQYYLHNQVITCVDLCTTATLSWFGIGQYGADNICFSLASTGFNIFQYANDWFGVQPFMLSRISLLQPDWATGYSTATPPTPAYPYPKVFFDMRGWEGLIDLRYSDSVLYLNENTSTMMGIMPVSTTNAYNKSTQLCAAESEASCAMKCLAEQRVANSTCWPLAAYNIVGMKPASVPFCTTRFTLNFSVNDVEDSSTARWNDCLYSVCERRPCTISNYIFMHDSTVFGYGVNISIYGSRFVYPILTEFNSMDFSAFLAYFGCLMGFWFGGSIIALVHLVMFTCISYLVHTYYKRKGDSQDDSQTAEAIHLPPRVIKAEAAVAALSDISIPAPAHHRRNIWNMDTKEALDVLYI